MRALRGIFSLYHRKLKYKSYNYMGVPKSSWVMSDMSDKCPISSLQRGMS
jgi:hypothetical protein